MSAFLSDEYRVVKWIPKVLRDLFYIDVRSRVASDPDHVVAELLRYGLDTVTSFQPSP